MYANEKLMLFNLHNGHDKKINEIIFIHVLLSVSYIILLCIATLLLYYSYNYLIQYTHILCLYCKQCECRVDLLKQDKYCS